MNAQEIAQAALAIPGQMWPAEMHHLARLIREQKATNLLEVGSLAGRSLFVAGMTMQPPGRIIVVDPFDPASYAEGWREPWINYTAQANRNTRNHLKAEGQIIDLERTTLKQCYGKLERLAAGKAGQFDFAYIDADHDYMAVTADIIMAWQLLAPGATMAGHDYWPGHPGVIRAVQEFGLERGLEHETRPDSRIWSIKKPST
jgi:predicted O-methyltransferase YrrM